MADQTGQPMTEERSRRRSRGRGKGARRTVITSERVVAATLLSDCLTSPYRSIDRLLDQANAAPAVRALVYGVLRCYCGLDAELSRRLRQPIPQKLNSIKQLMMIGGYQLAHGGVPPHAAIHEAVAACDTLGRTGIKALVNAVLRGLQRDQLAIDALTERSFDLPEWLEAQIREAWGERFEPVVRAFQNQPPMTLRINQRRISTTDYKALLDAQGGTASPAWLAETLVLANPRSQRDLPGYDDGLVSVQDASAQFAAHLLSAESGIAGLLKVSAPAPDSPAAGDSHRILDACAAPGGKLFHLMELNPAADIHAVEFSAVRAERLRAEADRLGFAKRLVLHTSDARTDDWWDGKPYDRILLDAPCTGTGTIRRRPDIKLHRQAGDDHVASLLQSELLERLWPKLAQGGRLLYCTCSILPTENQMVVEQFLQRHPEAELETVELPAGIALPFGWQLLPDNQLTDGFYYAALRRPAHERIRSS
ncbi:MAG: 16S rRNA (cytosine(967)-C(5))-methyltransferase RsmB [Gammaproteobacteria bacterium]|nr:16S rRNA (cytosine(967)-C(5))-methyltransferase RsmB [Gammaproteobacteria bacterium]